MTPEEIQQLVEAFDQNIKSTTPPIYIFISMVIVTVPVALKYIRKAFKTEVSEIVMEQIEIVKQMVKNQQKFIDTVKENQKEIKDIKDEIDDIKQIL